MTLILYQFPISHFCEKVRWALDYKGLPYVVRNLLPGPHILQTRKLAPKTTVPILVHGQTVVQNSGDIITYLDNEFPEHLLTPQNDALRTSSLEWESYVDCELGGAVMRIVYHYLFQDPPVLIGLFAYNGPWYGKLLYRSTFQRIEQRMRSGMGISEKTVADSKNKVRNAVDRIDQRLLEARFLTGDGFTRADVAAASLLAPFCRPKGYGIVWPETFPPGLELFTAELSGKLQWIHDIYHKYRKAGKYSERKELGR